MKWTAVLVVAGASLAIGVALGRLSIDHRSPGEPVHSDVTSNDAIREDLTTAKAMIADRERTIVRLREAAKHRDPEPSDDAEPAQADLPRVRESAPSDDEMIEELPGTPVAVATRSPTDGDINWASGFQTVLPDRDQASTQGFTISVNTNAVSGAVSLMLTQPDLNVESQGLTAIRYDDSTGWVVVYRNLRSDGLRSTGGFSTALRRAKDLADVWQTVAKRGRSALEVPRVIGCSTARFETKGVQYTVVTCVEYGPDGKPTAVTVRDGR